MRSCYEAGRDGFWPHRLLTTLGVTNVVVDSSSIEVSRRARRAKTDRLDGDKLTESHVTWDIHGLLQQLGAAPEKPLFPADLLRKA